MTLPRWKLIQTDTPAGTTTIEVTYDDGVGPDGELSPLETPPREQLVVIAAQVRWLCPLNQKQNLQRSNRQSCRSK
jgi:hypothetical protein